jgi:hypothetical protein
MLAVTLPSAVVAGETFEVQVIGAWMQHALAGAEIPGVGVASIAATVPYSSFTAMTASPAARIATSDAVLVLRYMGAMLTGVYQTSFAQSDTMDTISGTMVPVTGNQMLSAAVDPAALASRYTPARPAMSGLGMSWAITAAPGAGHGATLGPLLNAAPVMMTDPMITTSFGNPFESLGWRAVLSVSSSEHRTFTYMAMPVTLSAAADVVVDAASPPTLDFKAPMPEQVNLDDNQLVTDGQQVVLDTSLPHTLALLAENKPATLYGFDIYEISMGMTAPQVTLVFTGVSTQPKLTIPPSMLVIGHTYYPHVTTMVQDYPNAATGDLTARALPGAYASFDGGVFTVMP